MKEIIVKYQQKTKLLNQKLNKIETEKYLLQCEQNSVNESNLIVLLSKAIKNNVLQPNLFLYKFIKAQLEALLCKDARSFRWDQDIIHWTIKYLGGEKVIQMMKEESSQNEGKTGSLLNFP